MSGNINAKSNLVVRQPANVIWSALYDSAQTINTRARFAGSDIFFKSTITSDDSRGNAASDLAALFGTTGDFEVQYIITQEDVSTPTPLDSDCDDTWSLTTAPTTAPTGKGNEVAILQKRRTHTIGDGSRPQLQTIGNFLSSTRRRLCIKQKFKLPSNLAAIFDSFAAGTNVRWMEFLAIKCGNLGDPNGNTDSRFNIQAVRLRTDAGVDETGMRYRVQFDAGTGATEYWKGQSDEGTLVPGVWHEYTIYIEQPVDTSDLTSGRCKCVIQNLVTGEFITVIDRVGGRFYGPLGRKMTRVSPQLCYTGGWPSTGTIEIKFSDCEFSENARYPLI